MVGHGQVKLVMDKVKVLQGWARSRNKWDIPRFLGLWGYYCSFIPNYAMLATALAVLTQSKNRTRWKLLEAFYYQGLPIY